MNISKKILGIISIIILAFFLIAMAGFVMFA